MNIYPNILLGIANNKYVRTYLRICDIACNRADTKFIAKELFGYVEKHHILPKSFKLGGSSDPSNYVYLTPREHFVCHHLLIFGLKHTKFYGRCLAAIVAFQLNFYQPDRKLTARQFEYIKICNSKRASLLKGISIGSHSKERCKNISLALKNLPKKQCRFCKQYCSQTNYSRWHGTNCKLHPEYIGRPIQKKRPPRSKAHCENLSKAKVGQFRMVSDVLQKSIIINPEEYDKYVNLGWRRGRKPVSSS